MIPSNGAGSAVLKVHDALIADGIIEPLSRDAGETRLWRDCELASLIELRFNTSIDPASFTEESRAHYEVIVRGKGEWSRDPHADARVAVAYWMRDGDERVGTIVLSSELVVGSLVVVSSLYVLQPFRRSGLARRLLRCIYGAACAYGLDGVRLSTYWTWPRAVQLYLGIGMWILSWKHSLVFLWRCDLPEHSIQIGDREAQFGIVQDGRVKPLIIATREGDRLGWVERPVMKEHRDDLFEVYAMAPGTFAVALALKGWPLIRSDESWGKRYHWSDCGEPEGLAHKIEIFEAIARRDKFDIITPRIPGLAYRALDAID